jgi:hypothetical protein
LSFPSLPDFCERCLRSERWGGSVVLMVVDAALTSSGLNYFTAVVPKVKNFSDKFVKTGRIRSLQDLAALPQEEFAEIWKNERQWLVAREIARRLSIFSSDEREALRRWARGANPKRMREDPIGSIKGVGLVTFQYLRAMGGVDVVVPDRVVKKVINRLLVEAGFSPAWRDWDFIRAVEELAELTGLRRIEICWLTWLLSGESERMRSIMWDGLLDQL